MADVVLYSGGYARPYSSDADEVATVPVANGWFPATLDFENTANASGGGTKVNTLTDIINFLANQTDGSVDNLFILGHANRNVFSLGGTIMPGKPASAGKPEQGGDIIFNGPSIISVQVLTANASLLTPLKKKFSAKGKIILVGCDAGMNKSLLDEFNTQLGVCTAGFSQEVHTGITWTTNPIVIKSRGHVNYDSSSLEAAGLGTGPAGWSKDVHTLAPDMKSKDCK